jgi:hypothetical protein
VWGCGGEKTIKRETTWSLSESLMPLQTLVEPLPPTSDDILSTMQLVFTEQERMRETMSAFDFVVKDSRKISNTRGRCRLTLIA